MPNPPTRAQAILHPVRARILIALSDRALIPRELARQMEEIPLGTIYRHHNILLEAGLIRIAEERRVHGTVERRFALVESAQYVTPEELTGDDILGLVTALTGVVQASFGRYVRRNTLPPAEGEIAFVAKSLYLSDEEYQALRKTIGTYLGKTGRQPSEELHRRFIAFFSAPDADLDAIPEEKTP